MKIATLIDLAQTLYEDGTTPLRYVDLFRELADALRAQAKEIEELEACEERSRQRISALSNSIDKWVKRVFELEAVIAEAELKVVKS